nr:Nematode insulin-related peptide domain containing protein [Haemonchus contortus]
MICALVLTFTVVDVVHSSPQRRFCGKHLTKRLIDLCGAVKTPLPDHWETGRKSSEDQSIVHECCRKSCDDTFMRRYCAEE